MDQSGKGSSYEKHTAEVPAMVTAEEDGKHPIHEVPQKTCDLSSTLQSLGTIEQRLMLLKKQPLTEENSKEIEDLKNEFSEKVSTGTADAFFRHKHIPKNAIENGDLTRDEVKKRIKDKLRVAKS